MSNDSEFDPVEFYKRHILTTAGYGHYDTLRALAAESARRQAVKDAGICRSRDVVLARKYPVDGEKCAQAIEREAGL